MNKSKLAFIFVLLLLIFHGIGNWQFLMQSRFYFQGNSAQFYNESVRFFYSIKEPINPGNFIKTYTSLGRNRCPPFFMITAGLSYFIFGLSQNTAIMTNLLYLSILLFATYGIAKKLYNFQVGVLACFLLSMFPATFGYSRVFMLDFPLAAWVSLSLYLFLLSDNFANLKYSTLTGISFGIGLLIKGTFPIFILPVIFIYSALKKKLNLRNLGVSLFLGLILAATWYLPNWPGISKELFRLVSISSPKVLYFDADYVDFFYQELLLLPFFVIFLISLIFSVIKKKDFFLPLAIIIPVAFFSLSLNRMSRFILPVFTLVAIMMANFICALRYRRLFTFIIVVFSLAQYFLICFIPSNLSYLREVKAMGDEDQHGYYAPIDRGYWKTNEVLELITANTNTKLRETKVLIISPHHRVIYPLKTLAAIKRIPIRIYSPADWDPRPLPESDLTSVVLNSKYVMYKTGDQGIPWHRDCVDDLYSTFAIYKDKFSLLEKFNLPDSSILYLYKRKGDGKINMGKNKNGK